ncbi:heavy-metal-associated domain-containing protein [Ornithinibacillus sp. 179-J 7C1 HS]|uniref:heavy-metal-associated domain-containing protein n=1 Tax=Ornithinibacillus sp. 179-J 7C1 HS TaxID=3142384 RepID=UPI0039A287AC
MNETIYIDIKGMHCPDCPKKVEKSLSKLVGVAEVSVNYETENGTVTFNRDLTSISEIVNRINKMGFTAENIQSKSETTI